METITIQEAEAHFSRYLAEVEKGREFLISRDNKPVAKWIPIPVVALRPRPKVGEILGPAIEFPDSAFAPLTEKELKEWGL